MIQIQNLVKKYGNFVAIRDVSFKVKKGEIFALLGPNGSGKTTTLKCIVGLSLPNSGDIYVNGIKISGDACNARAMMSYLPQRLAFHESLTGQEILEFYCRLRRISARRIETLLSESNFHFNGFLNRPVNEFSGGMIQRLGLAVACLSDTPILILDEPTISLDPEAASAFRQFLKELKHQGKTVLFSSHLLSEAEQVADRVGILVQGKLITTQSVDEYRKNLEDSCRLRVDLGNSDPRLREIAIAAGAEEALLCGTTLLIKAPQEIALQILNNLQSAGGQIHRFASQEKSLEDLYMSYTNEKKQ